MNVNKIYEAYSKYPVSLANLIVLAFALGGCYDFAFLGTLPDSWLN